MGTKSRAGASRREVRLRQLQGQWRRWGLESSAQSGAGQGREGRKLTVDCSAAGPGHGDAAEGSFLESQGTRDSHRTKEQEEYKAWLLLL